MFSASFQGSSIHFEYVLSAAKPRRSMDGSEKVRGGRGVDHILEMDSRNSSLDNKLLMYRNVWEKVPNLSKNTPCRNLVLQYVVIFSELHGNSRWLAATLSQWKWFFFRPT